jgi:hypothetical protein
MTIDSNTSPLCYLAIQGRTGCPWPIAPRPENERGGVGREARNFHVAQGSSDVNEL